MTTHESVVGGDHYAENTEDAHSNDGVDEMKDLSLDADVDAEAIEAVGAFRSNCCVPCVPILAFVVVIASFVTWSDIDVQGRGHGMSYTAVQNGAAALLFAFWSTYFLCTWRRRRMSAMTFGAVQAGMICAVATLLLNALLWFDWAEESDFIVQLMMASDGILAIALVLFGRTFVRARKAIVARPLPVVGPRGSILSACACVHWYRNILSRQTRLLVAKAALVGLCLLVALLLVCTGIAVVEVREQTARHAKAEIWTTFGMQAAAAVHTLSSAVFCVWLCKIYFEWHVLSPTMYGQMIVSLLFLSSTSAVLAAVYGDYVWDNGAGVDRYVYAIWVYLSFTLLVVTPAVSASRFDITADMSLQHNLMDVDGGGGFGSGMGVSLDDDEDVLELDMADNSAAVDSYDV